MLSTLKPVVVLALLSATALASSHGPRAARHHAIAERQPLQGANLNHPPVPVQGSKPAKAKRVKRKTCRPRKTTSLVAASTAVSATVTSSSVEATSTVTSSSKVTTSSSSTKPIETSSSKPVETSSSKPVETSSTKQVETSSTKSTETFVPQTSVTPSSTVEKTSSTQQATSTHSEEPKTTTQAPPPPPETTTEKPTSTKTTKAQTTTQANTGSGSGDYVPAQGSQSFLFGQQTGDATFYDTGLTACGGTFSNSDYIVAVSQLLFDAFPGAGANPNLNPVCGKKILASMPGGGSVTVTVQDRCTGCDTTSLDFTPTAFNHLGSQAAGRLHGMTWKWVE